MEKDAYISTLENKITTFEEVNDLQNLKINKLEKDNEENLKNIKILSDQISKFEKHMLSKPIETFKCSKCDCETQYEKGLKTLVRRKHTTIDNEVYPKVCDLCESEITSAENMRKHLKTHSFKDARFKCEDCEFVGESRETMELHSGRAHTDTFECGICENTFGNSENLEAHIRTCEVYRCKRCHLKETNLSNMKAHIQKKHNKEKIPTIIQHLKISRNSDNEVTYKEHFYTDL